MYSKLIFITKKLQRTSHLIFIDNHIAIVINIYANLIQTKPTIVNYILAQSLWHFFVSGSLPIAHI